MQVGVVLVVILKTHAYIFMAMLQHVYKIEEEVKQDSILFILSDKYCRGILETTIDKPKSVMEITADTHIPISTVYRRVQALHDSKLLRISGSISKEGKKFFLYKSNVKSINTNYNNGKVEIELVYNR